MMRADARKGLFLILNFEIRPEVASAKRSIVRMVALDTDTVVTGEFIEVVFGFESFANTEVDLMVTMNVCCRMIHKQSAPIVLGGLFLFAFGV
jgi:hypothetical protein